MRNFVRARCSLQNHESQEVLLGHCSSSSSDAMMKRKQWEARHAPPPTSSTASTAAQNRAALSARPASGPSSSTSQASTRAPPISAADIAAIRIRDATREFAFYWRLLPAEQRRAAARTALQFLIANWPSTDVENKKRR